MVIPYIVFHGECENALKLYQETFGCAVQDLHRYEDYVPEVDNPPDGLGDWVLHAELEICGGRFWFADEAAPVIGGDNVRLALSVSTATEAKRIFDCLGLGGKTMLPPTETFYSAFHASLVDRFGVYWNIVAEEAPSAPDQ